MTTFAIMQKSPQPEVQPPAIEQLKRAFSKIPGLTAYDASKYCQETFGMIARNFTREQATVLQAALAAEGIEAEAVEEPRLPALPMGKMVRRVEITPQALMIYDPVGQKFPLEWGHVMVIAAGKVSVAEFTRVREEREASNYDLSNLDRRNQRQPKKVTEYKSKEKLREQYLLEIILSRAVMRYGIEADRFDFGCLGERAATDEAGDFCLLVRELAKHAPQAVLNRGARAMVTGPGATVSYRNKSILNEEMIWQLWRMSQGQTPG
jgi:hypothetical protein